MSRAGWWKFHRQAFESELKPTLREPACRLAAWAWIISETKHRAAGGLKRGEIRLSTRRLADVMCWPRPRAQRFLKWLVDRGMLSRIERSVERSAERSPHGTHFVVVSYGKFQDQKNERSVERSVERSNTKKVEEGKKTNGVAVASKREGGDAGRIDPPRTKKKPAAKKPRSLDAQRAYMAAEIAKASE